jgi:hypothetical protein
LILFPPTSAAATLSFTGLANFQRRFHSAAGVVLFLVSEAFIIGVRIVSPVFFLALGRAGELK